MNDYTALTNIYPVTWTVNDTTMIAVFFFARYRAYNGVRETQAANAKHRVAA